MTALLVVFSSLVWCGVAGSFQQLHSPTAPQCGPQLNGTAFQGAALGYALTSTPEQCCAACSATPLCAAYTWVVDTDPFAAGGRCFLKTAGLSPFPQATAVSGKLTSTPSSSCAFGTVPCPSNSTSPLSCALFSDSCNSVACGANETICPDGVSCGTPGAGWDGCPGPLPPWLDPTLPAPNRTAALLAQLSLTDIAPQLNNQGYGKGPPGPPGIPRLSVPPYNWLNEGLHGVARAGLATSFPQISVLGSTWNRTVWATMGKILGVEARAKYNMNRRANATGGDYTGVTFYAPNINLFRDIRWGRGQEVPSECPLILGEYAKAVIRAAQAPISDGSGSTTPAIYGCCKHMAVYSFESYKGVQRSAQNALVDGRDLLETYFPAFQACLLEGRGKSIMCSYNAVNNVPTCASAFLLNLTARVRYNFTGWIMSDYSAIGDTYGAHGYCAGAGSPAAARDQCISTALRVGVDQDGGGTDYLEVPRLVASGLLTEGEVRVAAGRLFQARMELGLLDPPTTAPYSDLSPEEALDTPAHRAAAYEAAVQGMVLLSNPAHLLPLRLLKGGGRVCVAGPNANAPAVLYGNYAGTPPYLVTPFAGLAAALAAHTPPIPVDLSSGCLDGVACRNTSGFPAALACAQGATLTVAVVGLDASVEAEGLDRTSLSLPGAQVELVQALVATGTPVVLVLITGGPVDVRWALPTNATTTTGSGSGPPSGSAAAAGGVGAMVLAGYASQATGIALADVLLGKVSPAGKLAVSWHGNASTDLPDFGDMGMRANASSPTFSPGRTYRYTTVPPVFPFGHGMTFSSFAYSDLVVGATTGPCTPTTLSVTITNTGGVSSGEVVQVYTQWLSPPTPLYPTPPNPTLAAFERIPPLAPGAAYTVAFTLPPRALARVNASAAEGFGVDFASPQEPELGRVWRERVEGSGGGAYGWDDMWVLGGGGKVGLWVGGGQPNTGTPGLQGIVIVDDTLTNLAMCAMGV